MGTGPGDPGLLTLRAVQLMQTADVILYDRLVSDDILQLVHGDARMVYVGKQAGYHTRTQVGGLSCEPLFPTGRGVLGWCLSLRLGSHAGTQCRTSSLLHGSPPQRARSAHDGASPLLASPTLAILCLLHHEPHTCSAGSRPISEQSRRHAVLTQLRSPHR